MKDKIKIAQLQTPVCDDKEKNLETLGEYLNKVSSSKPDLVTAGEMFCCPYDNSCFPKYAEPEGAAAWQRLSADAREFGVYLQAGTVPERDEQGRIYNTAYVFDPRGRQIAKHRKVHLFDIDVEGGQSFRESDTLTAGDQITVFDTEFCRIGLCICFDCRFPEMARIASLEGAQLFLVPAAFNMTTGPAHWELMFRSRAVDDQMFVVGTSDARDMNASYHAWGHSMIVDPWGTVISEMDENPDARVTEIDLAQVDRIRRQLPLLSARRDDLYTLRRK